MSPSPSKRLKLNDEEEDDSKTVTEEFLGFDDDLDDYEMLIESSESEDGSGSESSSGGDSQQKVVVKQEELKVEPEMRTVYCDVGYLSQVPALGCVRHTNGTNEFITVEALVPWKVGHLGCSARIFLADMEVVVHNLGCLMVVDDSLVAKVALGDLATLSRARGFEQAKVLLFGQLRIVQVLQDHVMAARVRGRAALLSWLKNTDTDDASLIYEIVQKSTNLSFIKLCLELSKNRHVSENLRKQAAGLLEVELDTDRRNKWLMNYPSGVVDDERNLNVALELVCEQVLENHTNVLLEAAPAFLRDRLKDVPPRSLYQVDAKAVKMFHDLDTVLSWEMFEQPLDDLAGRWINRVKEIKTGDAIAVNPVFFSLCRSLEEVIMEIASGNASHGPQELLLSDRSGWHPLESIDWRFETDLSRSLHREYRFIFRLLKHFDPASCNEEAFVYHPRQLCGNLVGIADEFYVWFCLLDDALPESLDLNLFEPILRNFVQLLSTASHEQLETVRVITLNTIRFVVQTADKARSGEDRQILQSQMEFINRIMHHGTECTNHFRDLIDVFGSYWKHRSTIVESIPAKNGHEGMERIKKDLLKVVIVALGKSVGAGLMVGLFRSLNDFLVELDSVPFDWLIKPIPGLAMSGMIDFKLVEPVVNVWNGTVNQTYRVIEPLKFQQMLHLMQEGSTCPRHYVIDAMATLLKSICSQLECAGWSSESDRIVSSGVLISSIQSSLMYLREQADYVSFESFLEESTKPFCNLIEAGQSLDGFLRRVSLIKDSFAYMRKQNEINLPEALRMFRELNDEGDDGGDEEKIKAAYQQYIDQFEQYMATESTTNVANLVRERVVLPTLCRDWSVKFKQAELPKILAGVAAVWSIAVSADVSSTGKYFKPHCVQVLCVLKLLGADDGKRGVSKHLAQVLTGQGKSLILALIASVLALTGHRIQLVCYNEYLVKRDAAEFEDFYNLLGVNEAIKYGTFEDMANAVLAPEVDGKRCELRSFVRNLILSNAGSSRPTKPKPQVQENSVLLMDEVDVFFTKEYYGSVYCPASFPYVPGLARIQERIWYVVNALGLRDVLKVTSHIQSFVASPFFPGKVGFAEFLNKLPSFELLIFKDNKHVRQLYTGQSLFHEHLNTMILNAIEVATNTSTHQDYKLSPEGVIVRRMKEKFENRTFIQYYSVFNYFRLKAENFSTYVNGGDNYGYLNIGCGSLAYAMLPKAYPLILGVTGTLTALNPHEKAAIKQLYDINRTSVMPSFFGCSKLHFNPALHFTKLPTKSHWLNKIFTHVLVALASRQRSVIVFFHSESSLDEFRAQFSERFARLQTLTENTDKAKQDQLIAEAGVPSTVTLATRAMGRGVDYRSSVAVEKSGGVHVIQTFFSLDVKEERQIRGRTARKDNRGTYELVVWEGDLNANQLMGRTYAELDLVRASLAARLSEGTAKAIETRERDHETTMQYLQSFFEC